jgi:hypothetical protein
MARPFSTAPLIKRQFLAIFFKGNLPEFFSLMLPFWRFLAHKNKMFVHHYGLGIFFSQVSND